jgi:hypothetical protein
MVSSDPSGGGDGAAGRPSTWARYASSALAGGTVGSGVGSGGVVAVGGGAVVGGSVGGAVVAVGTTGATVGA